jgi:predicted DNA-binding protein
MPVKKRFWKRVNIQLSPEQHKRLTKLSAQKGRTFAGLAWRAIDEYLEREAEKN